MHLDTMSLYHDNRFNRNIMYIYKDLEKTIDIAKKYKKIKNKLHKLSLEWINLEAYEIFNLASKDILKSLDNPESKNNDKEITNFDNLESFLYNYGLNFKDLFLVKLLI